MITVVVGSGVHPAGEEGDGGVASWLPQLSWTPVP